MGGAGIGEVEHHIILRQGGKDHCLQVGILGGLEFGGRGGKLGPGGGSHNRVVPLAQAHHLAGPVHQLHRPAHRPLPEHVVGLAQGILVGVVDLLHHRGHAVIQQDLLIGHAGGGPVAGDEGRLGQLQLEIVEARQLQLPAEYGDGGHRHVAGRAEIRDADVLRLLLMLQHIVHDLLLRLCKIFVLLQHQRYHVFSHNDLPGFRAVFVIFSKSSSNS